MARHRRFRRSRAAAEKVLEILDRLAEGRRRGRQRRADGKGAPAAGRRARRDGGPRRGARREGERRGPRGVRYLTLRGNEELFARLVRDDFDYLMSQRFAAPPAVLQDLLPQSVAGRAQNGHGWFVDEYGTPLAFPEATMDRVLTVLERHWPDLRGDLVRQRRTALVERVAAHVLAHLDRPEMPLEDADGPLLGVELLRGVTVATEPFLRGMVLAGHMDDWSQREMTLSWHRRALDGGEYVLGGGEIRVVERERWLPLGITDAGQREFTDEELATLERLGAILPLDDDRTFPWPRYDQEYLRRRLGEGVCDDLALIHAAVTGGYDALLGAFLMDGIDTYDKFLAAYVSGGRDGRLAAALQAGWDERHGRPLVRGEEILDLIWFAAKSNAPRTGLSSSHRRLIQYEPGSRVATLHHHWRFVRGEPLFDIKLGFLRVPAREFYDTAHRRLAAVALPVPVPTFRQRPGRETS